MPPGVPRTPLWAVGLALVAGLGICAVAAALMVPDVLARLGVRAWPVLVGGFVALFASLAGLWAFERKRDGPGWSRE